MTEEQNTDVEVADDQVEETTSEEVEEQETPDEEDSFPRTYVEKLRSENAKYRTRAQQADDLARRLHLELVRGTGRLADPEDLEFNEDHLEDEEALSKAIEDLLARKPHLASRTPRGDVGQGTTSADTVDLAAILRAAAS